MKKQRTPHKSQRNVLSVELAEIEICCSSEVSDEKFPQAQPNPMASFRDKGGQSVLHRKAMRTTYASLSTLQNFISIIYELNSYNNNNCNKYYNNYNNYNKYNYNYSYNYNFNYNNLKNYLNYIII